MVEYAIEREFEEVAAVVDSIHEPASLFGHSLAAAYTVTREVRAEEAYRVDPERFRNLATPTLLLLGEESPDWAREGTQPIRVTLPDARSRRAAYESRVLEPGETSRSDRLFSQRAAPSTSQASPGKRVVETLRVGAPRERPELERDANGQESKGSRQSRHARANVCGRAARAGHPWWPRAARTG
jgi:hypothetical protein